MTDRHTRRAARALAHLADTDPAAASLALWCAHRDGGDRTRTEEDAIFYGAEFPDLPLAQQVGLLAHHVLHVALRHGARQAEMSGRAGDRFDAELYQLATDAVVNETLLTAQHALPTPVVRLTELLFAAGIRDAGPGSPLAAWDADRLFLALLAAQPEAREAARRYGRTKGFRPDFAPDKGGGQGRDRAAEWQGHLARALAEGRRAGTGIGALTETLALTAPATVPWERQLRRLLLRAAQAVPRQSHRRPANRWIAMEAAATAEGGASPVFEPGRSRDARCPRIVVGVDTSSSVDDVTLGLFAAETGGIARRTGAEVHVLGFDTEVHARLTLGPGTWEGAIRSMAMRRGGGTDFRPVLDEASALAPSIVVILSDLDGPLGPAPDVPVVWAVPEPPLEAPAFGRVLPLGLGPALSAGAPGPDP